MIASLLIILFFYMLLLGDFEVTFYNEKTNIVLTFNGILWKLLYKLINIDKPILSIHRELK